MRLTLRTSWTGRRTWQQGLGLSLLDMHLFCLLPSELGPWRLHLWLSQTDIRPHHSSFTSNQGIHLLYVFSFLKHSSSFLCHRIPEDWYLRTRYFQLGCLGVANPCLYCQGWYCSCQPSAYWQRYHISDSNHICAVTTEKPAVSWLEPSQCAPKITRIW